MPETPTITFSMAFENAQAVLTIIGDQPFNKVAPLLMELRAQMERQVQTWQQQQAQPQPQPQAMPGRANGSGGGMEHAA